MDIKEMARELGRRGGIARAKKLTKEQISENGKKAVRARKWHKVKDSKSVI